MLKVWIIFTLLGYFCNNAAPIPKHLVDMSYVFNNETLHFPTVRKFEIEFTQKDTVSDDDKNWLALEEYSSSTHVGTHMDAPYHFAPGGWPIDQIPLDRLIAPVAVVNIEEKARKNIDYEVTVNDLLEWEIENDHLLNDCIVMIRSGWGQKWGDRESFTGTAGYNHTQMHFPGISPEAAQWLVNERHIYGLGTETLSLDYGPSRDFKAHRILNGENIYLLENVANVDKLPSCGATLHVMPMKIENGSGAPTRIFATIPEFKIPQPQDISLK